MNSTANEAQNDFKTEQNKTLKEAYFELKKKYDTLFKLVKNLSQQAEASNQHEMIKTLVHIDNFIEQNE